MSFLEGFSLERILVLLLIVVRVGGVFAMAPLFGNRSSPKMLKISLIFICSLLIFPLISFPAPIAIKTHLDLILAVIQELIIGISLGFVSYLILATIQTAGELMGIQMGFSIASIFDPNLQDSTTIIASFCIVLGSCLFLYLNGHHLILTALVRSFEILPLYAGIDIKNGTELIRLITGMFVVAIQISAPFLVVMTLLTFIFGLITKLSPQMNIYFNIGFIAGPILGLVVLLISLPLFRMLIGGMTEEMGRDSIRIVQELKMIR